MGIFGSTIGYFNARFIFLWLSDPSGGFGVVQERSSARLEIGPLELLGIERCFWGPGADTSVPCMAIDPQGLWPERALGELYVCLFPGAFWQVCSWQGDGGNPQGRGASSPRCDGTTCDCQCLHRDAHVYRYRCNPRGGAHSVDGSPAMDAAFGSGRDPHGVPGALAASVSLDRRSDRKESDWKHERIGGPSDRWSVDGSHGCLEPAWLALSGNIALVRASIAWGIAR